MQVDVEGLGDARVQNIHKAVRGDLQYLFEVGHAHLRDIDDALVDDQPNALLGQHDAQLLS